MQEPRAEGIGLGSDELFRERGGGGLEAVQILYNWVFNRLFTK